ncbi:hypothetical protein D9M72_616980 [compost metagenome]
MYVIAAVGEAEGHGGPWTLRPLGQSILPVLLSDAHNTRKAKRGHGRSEPPRSSDCRFLIANKSNYCSKGSDHCSRRRDGMEVAVFEEILNDPAERIW